MILILRRKYDWFNTTELRFWVEISTQQHLLAWKHFGDVVYGRMQCWMVLCLTAWNTASDNVGFGCKVQVRRNLIKLNAILGVDKHCILGFNTHHQLARKLIKVAVIGVTYSLPTSAINLKHWSLMKTA